MSYRINSMDYSQTEEFQWMLNHCVLHITINLRNFARKGISTFHKVWAVERKNEELFRYQSHSSWAYYWYRKNHVWIYNKADDWDLVSALSRVWDLVDCENWKLYLVMILWTCFFFIVHILTCLIYEKSRFAL